MQLDRNVKGQGKYLVINLRKLGGSVLTVEELAAAILTHPEAVEFNTQDYFVLKLNDHFTPDALWAYAQAAAVRDPEYADEIRQLAVTAELRADRKFPD